MTMRKQFATPQTALRYHVSGKIARREKALDVGQRHQLRIARDSMRMHCAGVLIMGGPNHYDAAAIIERLTGAIVAIDADCTCRKAGA